MSRRDYRRLASILATRSVPDDLLEDLCDWLQEDNARFDRQRFVDAAVPSPTAVTYIGVALDEIAARKATQ